jgi:hypothetical protein
LLPVNHERADCMRLQSASLIEVPEHALTFSGSLGKKLLSYRLHEPGVLTADDGMAAIRSTRE